MGKNLLVGVGGKARHVKALYVGVGGKARKVKKVYVGVGGKARLVYQSYIPVTGISLNVSYKTSTVPTSNRRYNYKAVIDATLSPSNATNQKITWKMNFDRCSGNLDEEYIKLNMPTSNNGKHLEISGYFSHPWGNQGIGAAYYKLVGTTPDGVSITKTVYIYSQQYTEDGDSDEVLDFTVS